MIDIDDILRERRLRERNAEPEQTEADTAREKERMETDKALAEAIERVHK